MHAHSSSNSTEATTPHCTEYSHSRDYPSALEVSYNMQVSKNLSEFFLQTKDKTVGADKLLTQLRGALKRSV